MRPLLRVAALLLVLLGAAIVGAWFWSEPPSPDAFYAATPPADAAPGTLLRTEPFTAGVPEGVKAWRILYTTTLAEGRPALASAVVMVASKAPPGPRPVIAWAHGTTGVVPGCAPSLQEKPFDNVPALPELLAQGWVYVGTDYAGLGTGGPHAYLIGEGEARSVLDSLRAARQIEGLQLAKPTVVWGHSQGGHAALWTGILAPDYASDIELVGVAALAPATDLVALMRTGKDSAAGRIISAYVASAYTAAYPNLAFADVVREGQRWSARQVAKRCLAGTRGLIGAIFAKLLQGGDVFAGDPGEEPLGGRLRENIPDRSIAAPVWVAQGRDDTLVRPEIQEAFLESRCAAGQTTERRWYGGLDHLSLVAPGSPAGADLVRWTADRFAGKPVAPGCTGDPR